MRSCFINPRLTAGQRKKKERFEAFPRELRVKAIFEIVGASD